MDELKACPFCGSSNTTLDYYEISCPQELGTIVVCNDCGASAKSIVDWNTRPIEDALNARIAELELSSVQIQYMSEDELPKPISYKVYSAMYPCSKVDFVRMFPFVMVDGDKCFLIKLPEREE